MCAIEVGESAHNVSCKALLECGLGNVIGVAGEYDAGVDFLSMNVATSYVAVGCYEE